MDERAQHGAGDRGPSGGPMLHYRARRDDRAGTTLYASSGVQFTIGFVSWLIADVSFFAAMSYFDLHAAGAVSLLCVLFGLYLTCGLWLFFARDWQGILPGMLTSMCITCLVPLGLFSAICGPPFR